jgi:hypothetical protein
VRISLLRLTDVLPCFQALGSSFIGAPNMSFQLEGVAGIPGLGGFVREQLLYNICYFMLWPRTIVTPFQEIEYYDQVGTNIGVITLAFYCLPMLSNTRVSMSNTQSLILFFFPFLSFPFLSFPYFEQAYDYLSNPGAEGILQVTVVGGSELRNDVNANALLKVSVIAAVTHLFCCVSYDPGLLTLT